MPMPLSRLLLRGAPPVLSPAFAPMYASMYALLLAIITALLAGCRGAEPDYYPGYVEADYLRLGSPVGGTVARLYVRRGDRLAGAAPLFVLEQERERAARAQAQAGLERAQAALANLEKGARPDEIAVNRAQLLQAEAALALSRAELARLARLRAAGFVSPARLDEARAALSRDQARARELQAQLRVAGLGARADELAAARQDVAAARAQVEQADATLADMAVAAPLACEVADVLYREGEVVPPGAPVVSLLAPEHIRARFFVPEAHIGALRLGQAVTLACDGCRAPIPATLSFIAREAEFTSPLIYSRETRATLVFMAEAIPKPAAARAMHPGQPLEVRLAAPP